MKQLQRKTTLGYIQMALFITLILGQTKTFASNFDLNATIDKPFSTSFDLVRGIILVEAELDGEVANFILDTGSPMMILNEKALEEQAANQANTIGGEIAGEWKKIRQ